MIIRVLVVSPHVHQYGSKQHLLSSGSSYYLDASIEEELEEIKFLVSASNPRRGFIYIEPSELETIKVFEESPEDLPISLSQPGRTIQQTLDELTAPSVEDEFITPPTQTEGEEINEDIILSDNVENHLAGTTVEGEEIDNIFQPEIHTIEIDEQITEKVADKIEDQDTEEVIAPDKLQRKEELNSLDWKKVKALASQYSIDYSDKAATIEKIIEFEF